MMDADQPQENLEEFDRLLDFVDSNPDMDADQLYDELEKRFSPEAITAFTSAFSGKVTPE